MANVRTPAPWFIFKPRLGRGETGADPAAIPTEAIKRVEILRDGASAQYGSDAIAGVMNVILKDRFDYTNFKIARRLRIKATAFLFLPASMAAPTSAARALLIILSISRERTKPIAQVT